MLYNDLQTEAMALLRRTDGHPDESLHSLAEKHQDSDFFSRLMAALFNVELVEAEASARFSELLVHHREMESSLGRRVDLRVAAMDYIVLNREIIPTPTIVDQATLQLAQRLAAIDEITGLFNRRFLETYLAKELKRAQRYDQTFAVLFLDLDDFKHVNDSHGHAVGDQVLAGLGRKITDMLRHEDFAARYGGEEFTIVMPQTTCDGAYVLGERLRTTVSSQDLAPDVRVSFSGGVASYPRHGLSVEAILQQADAALYDAKLSGKGKIVVSNAEKRSATRYRADYPAVAFTGNAEIGPLRLCDVSAAGCSLVSDDLLKPGQMLRVRVYSEKEEIRTEHEVLAHVVWSRRAANGSSYLAGGEWDPPHCAAAAEIVRSVTNQIAG